MASTQAATSGRAEPGEPSGSRPRVAVAAAAFLVMISPVVLVTPSVGITPAGQGLLVPYRLPVAVPLVAFITGAVGG